jgi:hypothetical protein
MDELAVKLAELADKFGVSVEYLWPLLVKKVIIDWWVGTGLLVLFMIISIVTASTLKTAYNNKKSWFWDKYGDISFGGAVTIFCWGVMTISVFITFLVQLSTISTLFVPEATVIRQLLMW